MAQINIGRGKVYVEYVGEGRYVLTIQDKLGDSIDLEMSKEQLDTLGKSFQVIAKDKK